MKNYFDLTGRVALITGGSSGLGVQFAKALASQNADIALCARRYDRLEEVKKEIEAMGVRCYIHKCDVTNSDEIAVTVKDTAEHYGRLDILVNNAGLAIFDAATEIKDEQWLKMMDTNLNQVYFFSREAARYMIPAQYGRIINIGSIHSTVSMTGFHLSAYGTTKGGVLMLTKSLANEWAKTGITVNAIGPAYFASEMTSAALELDEAKKLIETYCPMGRTGQAGELDTAILYFASAASSYTTGQLLQVDGGWTTI